ncbi:MAG: DUF882 domain-containing protein [Proteobacteria bacterium]|jgi:hypothetical protein|nr:DUF882 domain-containing protein [Pseudomonadota bacterium]
MSRHRQHLKGAILALAAAAVVSASARAQVSEEDPVAEAEAGEPAECRPVPDVKSEKEYPALDAPARRPGRAEVATTLFNVHSKETLPILKGRAPSPRLLALFFRCRGFATRRDLDPRLLEAVLAAAEEFRAPRVDVVSAYRSAKMNDSLAKKGRRVASESRHTSGEAIDFSLPSARARRVGDWLWQWWEGGVGIYDRDDFVHIDVGPKRRWNGR